MTMFHLFHLILLLITLWASLTPLWASPEPRGEVIFDRSRGDRLHIENATTVRILRGI